MPTEVISAWIVGVLSSVFFVLIAFLALNRSRRIDAIFVKVRNFVLVKAIRKFALGVFVLVLAVTWLGILYGLYINVWLGHVPVDHLPR